MADTDAYKRFVEARDRLTKVDDPGTQAPAAQAFVGDEGPAPVLTKEPPDLSKPKQDLTGMALSVGTGMASESAALSYIHKLPIPTKYKLIADIGAGVIAGGMGAFAGDLGWQNARRAMGDVTGPDTFDEALAISAKTGSEQAAGGAWGPMLGAAVGKTSLKSKVDDERLHFMKQVQDSMRRTYERIGGAPMLEDMRGRWNPMRIMKPFETELADSTVTAKFRNAGFSDPEMLRRVVQTGGHTTADLLDNTPYNVMQAVAEGSFSGKKFLQKYEGTRNKLYEHMLEDLSDEFTSAIPEEYLGKSVAAAVNGNFNLPNAVMSAAMNNVKQYVKPTYKLNMRGVKTYFKLNGIDETSPVGQMIHEQPNQTTFDAIYRLRSNLSSMMHALDTSPAVVAEAQRVAKTLDKSIAKQLPFEVQDHYKLAVGADDVLNQGQFKSKFVQGLLGKEEGLRAYGKYILQTNDVDNFRRLERAVGRGPADEVRRGISESVLQRAIDPKDGSLSPAMLHQGLNEHGKYGKYFLEATLGTPWMKNVETLQRSMETLLEASRGRSLSEMGLGSIKYASVAPLLWDVYHGQLDKKSLVEASLLFTGPKYLAKALTSPRAMANIERLSQMAATGTNPHRFSRLVARTAEAVGITPEVVAAAAGVPGATGLSQLRKTLGEGRMPSTGSPLTDAILNPGQTLTDWGKGVMGGGTPSGLEGPPPGQVGESTQ